MAEVLVLVDHVDGTPKKVSYELLTLARELGTPSAVVLGAGASAAGREARRLRRREGLRQRGRRARRPLVAPKATVLAQLVSSTSPVAVLLPSNAAASPTCAASMPASAIVSVVSGFFFAAMIPLKEG